MPIAKSGTNRATAGFRRITRLAPPVPIRVFGFVLVITTGSLLVWWIVRTSWNQLEQLQREHAAVKSESFYMGVAFRSAIRGLNDRLLRLHLSHDPAEEQQLLQEAAELKTWARHNGAQLAALTDLRLLETTDMSRQIELLQRAEREFETHWSTMDQLLKEMGATSPPGFDQVYRRVRDSSRGLMQSCDALVLAQRAAFNDFLAQTQGTIRRQQRLMKLLLGAIVGLAIALGLLIYKGMIAPLLRGLAQSKKVIERQEKLASLGTLASGVAHEIRNPLTAIKFRLFSLKNSFPALATNEDAVVVGSEINRLERIVRDFLQFARPSEPELTRVRPDRAIEDALKLLRHQLERSAIEVRVQVDADGAVIQADREQLQQVLINLIQNAAEAIGREGEVHLAVRTATEELGGQRVPAVVIAIVDSGRGISPEVEARLFDPFFSTKEGGTGLGLAIASRIVEKHGGVLRYTTQAGGGTTFEIVLPALSEHAIANHTD